MKDISNIFFKLGGGSKYVLDKITTLREHEKRIVANMGMLLLIPVTFSGLGMLYTLSIYTNNYYIIIIGSLFWCFTIFALDSSFINSLRKSRHNNTGLWYYVGVLLRLAIACLIGYLVSHQLLFYIFEDDIDAKTSEMSRQEKTAQVEKSREYLKNARLELENSQININKDIQTHNNKIQCLSNLISLEQSYKGDQPKEVIYNGENCGYASGKGASCEGRCKSYIAEKDRLISDRDNLIVEKKEIEQSRAKEIENLSQIFANDEKILVENKTINSILQKDKSLNELVKENSAISRMYWALLLLFMIIDTLVVVVKLTLPMGMYEHTMDAMIEENKAILKAEENANILYARTVAEEEALIVAKNLGLAKSISVLAEIPFKISEDIREVINKFGKHMEESKTAINKEIDIEMKVDISSKYEDLYLKLMDKAFTDIEKE